jgi:hypothetical protein
LKQEWRSKNGKAKAGKQTKKREDERSLVSERSSTILVQVLRALPARTSGRDELPSPAIDASRHLSS